MSLFTDMGYSRAYSIIALLITILIAPCSLEHYNPSQTIKIVPRFPSANKKSSMLSRPDGSPANYVPDFVDWIQVKVTGENVEDQTLDVYRDDAGEFLGETYLTNIDYESVFNFEISVFAGSHNSKCNPGSPDNCTLTHEGLAQNISIDSSSENENITIPLEYISADLDNSPVEIIINNETSYCLTLNENNNFVFGFVDATPSFAKIRTMEYSSSGELLSRRKLYRVRILKHHNS